MTKITIKQVNVSSGAVTTLTMPGTRIGPFGIHRSPEDTSLWTVTHIRTGHACQRLLPSSERAEWLARKLLDFDVWRSRSPKRIRESLDAETMAAITVLRMDAMNGDCQGEVCA